MRILLAEADALLAESFRRQLEQERFTVQVASSNAEVKSRAISDIYDVVVLGLNAPPHSGVDLLRCIKSQKPQLPVLVVGGPCTVEERVRALDAGADDYLVEPFAFAEFTARMRAVLRRSHRPAGAVLTVGDLALDRLDRTVERSGQPVELSPREFTLLEFLMRHAGQPVTRTAIVEQVWKTDFEAATNVVDVYINYLRRKVDKGHDHALIRTIRGVGYQIGNNGVR
jgi:two-component system, OmpR family, copper resistance phosphate regulon response regulator CusR